MEKFGPSLILCNMYVINEHVVREKVLQLMKSMGISKKKLGEILGSEGDHVNVRINRANRFLMGDKKKLTLQEINRIALFFEKSPTWFFHKDSQNFSGESRRGKIDSEGVLQNIENSLRELGFDENYINIQVQQIRVMGKYKSVRK
jgi:transcriptional regulator with XRE-family HTH domain